MPARESSAGFSDTDREGQVVGQLVPVKGHDNTDIVKEDVRCAWLCVYVYMIYMIVSDAEDVGRHGRYR